MILPDKYLHKETLETWNGALGLALEKQLNSHVSNIFSHKKILTLSSDTK